MRIFLQFCLIFNFFTKGAAQPDYSTWDNFLKAHVTAEGNVNYQEITKNKSLLRKITSDFSAQKITSKWSKDEQLAFWINAYNAFTIQLVVDNYPIKSIMDIDGGKTWDVRRIKIGDKKYSLNEIEHEIIRPQFKDARIHFALNCAARSCPPLLNQAFLPRTLDLQLSERTVLFMSKYQVITPSKAYLSKIMEWYADDFGNIRNFINRYSTVKVGSKTKITYQPYDWRLNEK